MRKVWFGLAVLLVACRHEPGGEVALPHDSVVVAPAAAMPAVEAAAVDSIAPFGIPRSVGRYHDSMAAFLGRTGRGGLASIWRLADTASSELLHRLDGMQDTTFVHAESLMTGFFLSKEEQISADPDLAYFGALAKTRGGPADQAFFAFVGARMPDLRTWAWDEQNCDGCWCARVGSPLVVDGYFAAESLLQASGSYEWWVAPRLRHLDSTYARSNCICETREEALSGIAASLARLPPEHPLRQPLEAGRQLWRQPNPDVKFSCIGG